MGSPFSNVYICLMTCTSQSYLIKIEEMQNNLVKGCGNYSLDKQYSC